MPHRLLAVVAVVVLAFAALPAHAQFEVKNDIVCPAELTYQDCVDAGYFNHTGNGRGGGGGSGGYCQNMGIGGVWLRTYCNGVPKDCPSLYPVNSAGSGQYVLGNSSYECCSDGTTGQMVVLTSCY